MSNITISNGEDIVRGTLVLTEYGKQRMLQRLVNNSKFVPINITSVGIGDKMRKKYNSKVATMGNEKITHPIEQEMITVKNGVCTIKTELSLDDEIVMQEIGLFETVNRVRRLFAYASGFSMVKQDGLSYSLIIDLELREAFENEHYSKYDVKIGDSEYAKQPSINALYETLTDFQLDLERCIQANSLKLGYNKPEVLYKEQIEMMQMLQNTLMFSRFEKIIHAMDSENMTDCFYYPETDAESYSIRNLQDSTSKMEVTGDMQICNKDNIDFSGPATIILTATIDSLDKTGMILGKVNPSQDMYYVDFRISSDDVDDTSSTRYLEFTIYSYDKKMEYEVTRGRYSEFELVGHYRIKYVPSEDIKAEILGREAMYTFIYNGDVHNPHIDFYINLHKIDVIEDTFNFSASEDLEDPSSYEDKDTLEYLRNPKYSGPCNEFRAKTTLRNYLQTSGVADFSDKPTYYILPTVKISSIFAFKTMVSLNDIQYLALISQS